MILHWPWPVFPCICALTVPASTMEERSVYCFLPVTQHSLLSFPLRENPYKVIPVGKIPCCVPCWNSLWWDWALGKGSDINAGLAHIQLLMQLKIRMHPIATAMYLKNRIAYLWRAPQGQPKHSCPCLQEVVSLGGKWKLKQSTEVTVVWRARI